MKSDPLFKWAKWFSKLCEAFVGALSMVAPGDITAVRFTGYFFRCECLPEIHWDLANIAAEAVTGANDPKILAAFLGVWEEKYGRLFDAMPILEDDTPLYSFFSNSTTIRVGKVVIFTRAIEIETGEQEHSEAFMDLAKRGDEKAFKDLARMTLANLTPEDIDAMWTGTVMRLKHER